MRVSCIMPTRGRREFAKQAVESFINQTYPDKELLIGDDINEPSFPQGVPTGQPIMRFPSASRSIPEKRNELCRLAKGDIIIHFDSDDWSAPERIADQVERLEISNKAVTGYHSLPFCDGTQAWIYRYGTAGYALGTSLCYRKSWWSDHPFSVQRYAQGVLKGQVQPWGEDNVFVHNALSRKQLISVGGEQMMVARIHADNTARKHTEGSQYRPIDPASLPAGFPR